MALVSNSVPWTWNKRHKKVFDVIKNHIAQNASILPANFNKPFDIHTDASNLQLGAVISQNGKPITLYSRNLNVAQTHYKTTEKYLLAIVETLKEFKNILLGQKIKVYTDHKHFTGIFSYRDYPGSP